jgi:predicted dehydrogenase
MLGHGFMGDAHCRALRGVGSVTWPVPLVPRLISISGRNLSALQVARDRYGWQEAVTDWTAQVADPRIQLFDNVGPNQLHVEPSLAALRDGKHVICEKPLAPSADEAYRLWRVAEQAAVVHVCAFNYRFFPAIRLAKDIVESEQLGRLLHFRSRFFTPRQDDAGGWRQTEQSAAGGVVGDMASHHIDLARYLLGEIVAVRSAATRTGAPMDIAAEDSREDAVHAVVEFAHGVIGTLEASRITTSPKVESVVEIDGTQGSLQFSLARLNELTLMDAHGSRTLFTTDPAHPFMRFWYPRGHPIGWGDSFLHQIDHALRIIAGEIEADGHLATFRDGYRCAEVCDAIRLSSRQGCRVSVRYRSLEDEQAAASGE